MGNDFLLSNLEILMQLGREMILMLLFFFSNFEVFDPTWKGNDSDVFFQILESSILLGRELIIMFGFKFRNL